ncbi:MAG: 50S ribosomal protein L24 [Rhodospirillales bacterium]|nr:50S ribosomal protein L24 [Rhodospirillales bacterium]MCY3854848.1 50S ribosomal protein L24 [Rhodospirillales bacterium]MCY4004727.1 50S ribosomal protein L24 [Rhodospirillales bacterium]MCY4098219.1 50S ribosomal protein L24 [Rhodospirillales bacterium]MDE0373864.1 50S ribosomal protein L24 [Rhodospirillales bacterium]
MAGKFRIRRGDEVVVRTGRDRGRTGEVIRVDREHARVVVRGVNIARRHMRPSPANPGGIVERELPIHVSNVALRDPSDGRPTKVGYRRMEDGRKVRTAKRSGDLLDD